MKQGKIRLAVKADESDPRRINLFVDGQLRVFFQKTAASPEGEILTEIGGPGLKARKFSWSSDAKAGIQRLQWADVYGNSNATTWSRETSQLLSANDWAYETTALTPARTTAEITRRDKAGHEQYFFRDIVRGIVVRRDGKNEKKSYYFVTKGPLYGKLSRKEETTDGVTKTTYRAFYDESGKLLRWTGPDDEMNVEHYDEEGRLVSETEGKSGPVTWNRQYDDQGRVVAQKDRDGRATASVFLDDGATRTETRDAEGNAVIVVKKDGVTVSREIPGKMKEEYGSSGMLLSRTLGAGDVYRYAYDDQGRLREVTKNAVPLVRQYYGPGRTPLFKVDLDAKGAVVAGVDFRDGKILSKDEAARMAVSAR